MCLEMRSLSAQAIGIDGEEYECDAELRRQKLLVLNHAAEEVETKIRARMKERARGALQKLASQDSHFATFIRSMSRIAQLCERIRISVKDQQSSEAELEYVDQLQAVLEHIVADDRTGQLGLHEHAIDEVRRIVTFGTDYTVAVLKGQGSPGLDVELTDALLDDVGSVHSGYASSNHGCATPSDTAKKSEKKKQHDQTNNKAE